MSIKVNSFHNSLEVSPSIHMHLGIEDFFCGEIIESRQVDLHLVVFEEWNSYLSQVNNKVVLYDIIVYYISFSLSNGGEHLLLFSGFGLSSFHEASKSELVVPQLSGSYFFIFHLFDSVILLNLYILQARDGFQEWAYLPEFTLYPISNMFERILHILRHLYKFFFHV